jgi:hypothetical protein
MPEPTPTARAALDKIMLKLAPLGDTLTIEDFRTDTQIRTKRTAQTVRMVIVIGSILFLTLALAVIFFQSTGKAAEVGLVVNKIFSAALWAFALGGLGAIASIFIVVLNLIPQQTLRTSDLFEVIGRIILGCIFGTILATTIVVHEVTAFFDTLRSGEIPNSGILLLLPFLAGFSITLVLNLFEKIIRAIELTIGIDDRRALGTEEHRDLKARRPGRRTRGG